MDERKTRRTMRRSLEDVRGHHGALVHVLGHESRGTVVDGPHHTDVDGFVREIYVACC